MDLRKDSTIGGKRIATYEDFLKLEQIVGGSTGGGSVPSTGDGGSYPAGQYVYKIEIISSGGTKAVNGIFESTFTCKIYRYSKDVTDIILSSGEYQFFWERHSGDTSYDQTQDTIWANDRFEGATQKITSADIVPNRPNNFICSMYSKETGNVVLSSI